MDVTLALPPEAAPSALNTLSGTVAAVEPEPDGFRSRVRPSIESAGEIAALLTRRTVAAIGLAEGRPVLAPFKATAER
jgi:molybdopterin-binding protein